MAILLALLSSVLWGVSDFAGGTATRRIPVLRVVLWSQLFGLTAITIVVLASGAWTVPPGFIPWAIAAGLADLTGLVAYYRALAVGTMGVAAPIAALGVVVPVTVGLLGGDQLSSFVVAGIVLAVVGVVTASGPERGSRTQVAALWLAGLAAASFGSTLVFIGRAAAYSPLMTMVGMRVTSVTVLAIAVTAAALRSNRRARGQIVADAHDRSSAETPSTDRSGRTPISRRMWALLAVIGLFDVSSNLVFALSTTAGSLAIVGVLGSLYPAVTAGLAWAVHRERLSRVQVMGVAVVFVAVVLIAAG